MSDVQLDSASCFSRVKRLFDGWKDASSDSDLESLKSVDVLSVVVGDAEEDAPPKKGVALQTWLLAYEFPSTIIVFSRGSDQSEQKISILTSTSKAKILAQLKPAHGITLDVATRPKDAAAAKEATTEFFNRFSSLGSEGKTTFGHFVKDAPKGKLADEWNSALAAAGSSVELLDVTPGVSAIMAPKDTKEIDYHRTSSQLCSTVMDHYFLPKVRAILDKGTKMSHEVLASLVEEKLGNDDKGPDMKLWNKDKSIGSIDFSNSDWVYTPIIQSGGKYDLKVSAESNGENLKKGVIIASMGIKYKEYCSNIGRTFMTSPHESQQSLYKLLLEIQSTVLSKMRARTPLKDVYEAAISLVKQKKPDMAEHFVKTIGFATGIDFRDGAYVIGPKSTRTLRENMVFNLSLGFQGVPDPVNKGKTYALLLSDTTKVGRDQGVLLTNGCKALNEIVLDEEEEESEDEARPSKSKQASAAATKEKERSTAASRLGPSEKVKGTVIGNKVLRAKTRNQGKDVDETKAKRLQENQRKLHEKLQKEGVARFKGSKDGKSGSEGKKWQEFLSYRREDQLPSNIKDKRILVDEARGTIILPIYGYATPFHISTIKNVSKTEEGDYSVLRINFQTPGQIIGKKEDTPFEDPNATFIRSAMFRSTDFRHMTKVNEQITNMRKAQNKRDTDTKEMADVIKQADLQELKGRRPHKLIDVLVRPALDNKRVAPGDVEIHTNGLRYYGSNGNKVDILFSNVKHLFFQPCDSEMHVILHVHLKAPIMLNGKKKAKDIQFIREVSDAAFEETGNRKRKMRYGDDDEIEQEQEERRRRQQLNREFQAFATKVQEAMEQERGGESVEVDIPFRELGFNGVPFRSNVLLQPTTECLVHLSDQPFLVITLAEVEVVHLERVQFGLKNFDMVFVFSDFSKPPIHINSVPMESLDDVKQWLDSVDIAFSEGPVNLSWPAIMKTIQEDPANFYKDGGWSFLTGAGSDNEDDSDSEAESAFSIDSDELAADDDDDSESDFSDEDASEEDEDDYGSEPEDGEDWDTLERKAEREDADREDVSSDEESRRKSKKGGRR